MNLMKLRKVGRGYFLWINLGEIRILIFSIALKVGIQSDFQSKNTIT